MDDIIMWSQIARAVIFSQLGVLIVLGYKFRKYRKIMREKTVPSSFTWSEKVSIVLLIYAFIYMCINMAIRWNASPTWRIPTVFAFIMGFEYFLYRHYRELKEKALNGTS